MDAVVGEDGHHFHAVTVEDRPGRIPDAVVFHGGLGTKTPAQKGQVKAKILICNGADDKFVPANQIEAFKKEMKDAEVDMTFKSYPGAIHSFTNPAATKIGKKFKMPVAYNKKADKQSWEDMKKFLKDVLK